MLSDEEKEAIEIVKEIKDIRGMRQDVDGENEDLWALDKVIDFIEKQSKEIEELKDFNTKLQATKDRLDSYDKENTLKIEKLKNKCKELIFEKQELTSALLDSTPNDKIKAKIEYNKTFNDDIHKYTVLTLEELLEKD